ncbi:MAG TPA: glutamate-cysteine ligase family protein [Oligoflexia bacterium]|nr:glutamate-cysteine ligase family protein [Oligoflexia bacterium]HMR23723.1 glutamate-cysteine ligase family protein [Oligoflexia bacterium]
MSREVKVSQSGPIENVDNLLEIFINGAREPKNFLVGLETEKIGVYKDTLQAIPYLGDKGIEIILKTIADQDHWKKIYDQEHLIALEKDGQAITLEPGGQFELSGSAHQSVADVAHELGQHLKLLCRISTPLDIAWLGIGIQPVSTIDQISWVPKSRYKIMKAYFERVSPGGLEMMKLTASSQVNLDYSSEEDAAKKIRVGSVFGVLASALTANSAIEQGQKNGFCSRRLKVWQKTDKQRCGIPKFFVDGSFSFEQYRDYAQDIPMYFLYRNGAYQDATHQTFAQALKSGQVLTQSDWESHLTTLFPDVRLKNHLEFRTADASSKKLSIAITAFWMALLYNKSLLEEAHSFSKKVSLETLYTSIDDVALKGMQASLGKIKILDWANEYINHCMLAMDKVLYNEGMSDYLFPLREIADKGKSPAEQLLADWPTCLKTLCEKE